MRGLTTELELAGRLGAALVLGATIGFEREVNGQVAGLRTHMSVALGAALFAIVSVYGFDEFVGPRAESNVQVDVTRVASNIVTGVGFLGGGAILKEGSSVRGVTTAASLWVTAAVGLAVALGMYSMACLTALALILCLTLLRAPRLRLRQRFGDTASGDEELVIRLRAEADAEPVIGALRAIPDLEVRSVTFGPKGERVVRAEVRGPNLEIRLTELAERDEIVELDRR